MAGSAALCRVTGDLCAAEDAVQEACAAAVQQWPADGFPANPAGWLVRVARNKAVDARRRDALRSTKEQASMDKSLDDYDRATTEARDDMLSLIFLCCHPALGPSVRVALTLRTVCGLSVKEIDTALNRRLADIGRRPPRYLTDTLGPIPEEASKRNIWWSTARAVELYRAAADVTDATLLGRGPTDPDTLNEWLAADDQLHRASRVLHGSRRLVAEAAPAGAGLGL